MFYVKITFFNDDCKEEIKRFENSEISSVQKKEKFKSVKQNIVLAFVKINHKLLLNVS